MLQIAWQEHWETNESPIYLFSVDGVHCRINEPIHSILAKNPTYYSNKFNQSCLNYERALLVRENKFVWIKGPFPASKHDVTFFRSDLKQEIADGMKGIADNVYRGERNVLSTPNSHDPSCGSSIGVLGRDKKHLMGF